MLIIHYESLTAAGLGKEVLIESLYAGTDFSIAASENSFSRRVDSGGRICLIDESLKQQPLSRQNYQLAFESCIKKCWQKFYDELNDEMKSKLVDPNKKTLILLSSTKGYIEDYVWQYADDIEKIRNQASPFQALVSFFENLVEKKISNVSTQTVSNACASSHVAFEIADACLKSKLYDYVFVLAADLIGPFVYQGFNSLKVLTHKKCRPFDETRDGLQLGEAVAMMLLAAEDEIFLKRPQQVFKISGISSSIEAGSVTRPSMDGEFLYQLINNILQSVKINPDLFIAHGTGTVFNDKSETLAFTKLAEKNCISPCVTGIKWSLGHTLGASGLLDTIAACEVLRKQKVFSLMNTKLALKSNQVIFLESKKTQTSALKNIMVSSLGFGGIHAALLVQVL